MVQRATSQHNLNTLRYIMNNIDLNKYSSFVKEVTSKESNVYDHMRRRMDKLSEDNLGYNFSLLMTAAIGMSAECGEFNEIPKKIIFQGKEFNEENVFHMKRELGDIMLLQADNDGTFWPGYIEIPEEVKPKSNIVTDKEDNQKIIKNPRIYTGLGLLLVVSLFFLNKNSALILLILDALIATKE